MVMGIAKDLAKGSAECRPCLGKPVKWKPENTQSSAIGQANLSRLTACLRAIMSLQPRGCSIYHSVKERHWPSPAKWSTQRL